MYVEIVSQHVHVNIFQISDENKYQDFIVLVLFLITYSIINTVNNPISCSRSSFSFLVARTSRQKKEVIC